MIEILLNIMLLKIPNPDFIVAILSLFVSMLATYFTYKINRKIENFDKNQYNLAVSLLKDALSRYKVWCEDYIKNIKNNQYSLRNTLFPIEIFQYIIISNTQRDDFIVIKQTLLAIIMQINTINNLHIEIKSSGKNERAEFGIGYKTKQREQLIIDIQNLEKAITEFQEKFLI